MGYRSVHDAYNGNGICYACSQAEKFSRSLPRDVLLDVRLCKHTSSLYEIVKCMEQLAESRPDDWDVKGYALALRGLWMEMKEAVDDGREEE